MGAIKYCLIGKHQHRTPLSYPTYQQLLPRSLKPVDLESAPDLLVFGYVQDFYENLPLIREARTRNPSVKLAVLSEEPFWDTIWSGDYTLRKAQRVVNGESLDYYAINHVNSRVYDYEQIPYIVTTEDTFFARYSFMFKRNAAKQEEEYRRVWQKASIKSAFFAEKRLDDKFSYRHPESHVEGLCQFRSRLAEAFSRKHPEGSLLVGRGWVPGAIRQKLPDWHLDKLTMLDGRCRFISALENTHQPRYVTEKLFDAFACQGIPLYFASPAHTVNAWLPENAYINLYGLSVEDALSHLTSYVESGHTAEAYRQAQSDLARRFSSAETLERERRRVLDEVERELIKIVEEV